MYTLTVSRDPTDDDYYIARYTGSTSGKVWYLAHEGTLCDAINEALEYWGLDEDDLIIEASN